MPTYSIVVVFSGVCVQVTKKLNRKAVKGEDNVKQPILGIFTQAIVRQKGKKWPALEIKFKGSETLQKITTITTTKQN